MIGEALLAAAQPDGVPVQLFVPAGTTQIGLRAVAYPVNILLTDAGRVVASVTQTGPADEADFPGSGYSLLTSHDGQPAALSVTVSGADSDIYVVMQ